MITAENKRRKSNTFFEMKAMNTTNEKDKVVEKLGISIYASIDRLQELKAKIMAAHFKEISILMVEFQRQHTSFMKKQKSLNDIEEQSDKINRLKEKVSEFLSTFTTTQIENKLQSMRQEHIRASEVKAERQQQQQTQISPNFQVQSLRKRLLDQEDEELKVIQRLMEQVKKIAIDTSELIVGMGARMNIAAESIKQARLKMQAAKAELQQANQYQQDTAKTKIMLGCLICVILVVVALIMIAANKTK